MRGKVLRVGGDNNKNFDFMMFCPFSRAMNAYKNKGRALLLGQNQLGLRVSLRVRRISCTFSQTLSII